MHIQIKNKTPLKEISDVFASHYPYLRIEFYTRPHGKYDYCKSEDHIHPDILVRGIEGKHEPGRLDIMPNTRISDLERILRKRFGLNAQVLRKEKDKWIQTTGTDDLTLRELNEISRNLSEEFPEDEDVMDNSLEADRIF
jgi:hypothetical protein